MNAKRIAYLAPEIPSLGGTFVYSELLGLEKRGHRIVPFSVRRPEVPATNVRALADRTVYLYDCGLFDFCCAFGVTLRRQFRGVRQALAWLGSDVRKVGLVTLAAAKLVYQFLAACRLACMLREQRCGHLHVHFAHVPCQIAMYASAISGVPFTVTAHANDIFQRGLLLREKAERAKHFLTISEYNRRYLHDLGLPSGKLGLVRCGVSFRRSPRANRTTEGIPRIGSLGRLVEKKGMHTLLRAVALLRDRGVPLTLLIAGDGPQKEALLELVKHLGIERLVVFEGALAHDRVAGWMQSLSLFALACEQDANGDQDGIPVALMEAMSQGVPVVSTRISGIPELVIHEETGLLATPGDPGTLADQIERLLMDRAFASALADKGCEHVMTEFGPQINLDRLESYIGGGNS